MPASARASKLHADLTIRTKLSYALGRFSETASEILATLGGAGKSPVGFSAFPSALRAAGLKREMRARRLDMSSAEPQERTPGSLTAAVSRHVVRLFSEYTGRGPTRARTTIRDNVVVCVTSEAMTKGERRLVEEGEGDTVVSIRRKFQSTMRDDLVAVIEILTGRKVLSFMSDHDADHDYAVEVFVLDGRPETAAE
jgi:uncharacterized protein YbcI